MPGLAGPSAVQVMLDMGLGQGNGRRHPIDDATDGGAVAFPKGGDPVQEAEGVAGHGWVLHGRNIGCVHRFHADRVIAAIDVMDFAGNAAGKIAEKISAGAAHVPQGGVSAQR